MLTVDRSGKKAVLSTDTFLKGHELSAVRKARAQAARCGIVNIRDVKVRLDNRSGGVSRYSVHVSGDYVEPFSYPWNICYSDGWEIRQYGIGKGHDDGIWGQFPGNDGEYDFIMEQLYCADSGLAENPTPKFKAVTHLVRIK